MDRLTLDLRQIDRIDVKKLGVSLPPAAPRNRLDDPERAGLVSALDFGKRFNSQLNIPFEAVSAADHPPTVTVLAPAPSPAPLVTVSKSHFFTFAGGLIGSVFGVGGGSFEGGAYGSTTRELGVYFTFGVGLFSNAGVSGGTDWTIIKGTPADFSGPYIGVGASFGKPVLAVGATLLFLPGPPFVFMGIAVSFTAGPSAFPLTISIEVTETEIKPLVKF